MNTITQTIYNNGQLSIPRELISLYGFKSKTKIQIEPQRDGIFIRPIQTRASISNIQKEGARIFRKSGLTLADLLGGNKTDWDLENE